MTQNFIIIEPDPIVRLDIEGALTSRFENCHIHSGALLEDVVPTIQACGSHTTIFVRSRLLRKSSDLVRVMRVSSARGSCIIIIGDYASLDFPAMKIEMPFTTTSLNAALDGCGDAFEPNQQIKAHQSCM